MPDRSRAGGSTDGGSAGATDDDRNVGFLHWLGREFHVRKAVIFTLEAGILFGPQFYHDGDSLIGDGAPLGVGAAHGLKLLLDDADPYAKHQPAAGQDV